MHSRAIRNRSSFLERRSNRCSSLSPSVRRAPSRLRTMCSWRSHCGAFAVRRCVTALQTRGCSAHATEALSRLAHPTSAPRHRPGSQLKAPVLCFKVPTEKLPNQVTGPESISNQCTDSEQFFTHLRLFQSVHGF